MLSFLLGISFLKQLYSSVTLRFWNYKNGYRMLVVIMLNRLSAYDKKYRTNVFYKLWKYVLLHDI